MIFVARLKARRWGTYALIVSLRDSQAEATAAKSLLGGSTPISSDEILGNFIPLNPGIAVYCEGMSFWTLRDKHVVDESSDFLRYKDSGGDQ